MKIFAAIVATLAITIAIAGAKPMSAEEPGRGYPAKGLFPVKKKSGIVVY